MRGNNLKQGFRELKLSLKAVAADGEINLSGKLNGSVSMIDVFLGLVREDVLSAGFRDQAAEVFFFKFEKPEYVSLKIYQVAVYQLLDRRPAGTEAMLRAYYLEELRALARFFRQYAFMYDYFRAGFTELDEVLFVRGVPASPALVPDMGIRDEGFSTNGDYVFAQFLAYEQLQEFILTELRDLDGRNAALPVGLAGKKLSWTGEVINLVELGYGIYLSKQVGGGKATLQEIFSWLEDTFGVVIGIPAVRFRDIRRRKRLSRTHFTDLLRDALVSYMDAEFE